MEEKDEIYQNFREELIKKYKKQVIPQINKIEKERKKFLKI